MFKLNISSILCRCLIALLLAGTFLRPQAVFAASLPAEINKQFTPLQIDAGGVSVLRVTIFNPNIFPLTNASWTDNLIGVQPGLFIANPANVVNTCGAVGDVTAAPGTTTLSLANGTVPAQVGATPGQCYVEVNVSSVTSGNLINTIPSGNLNSQGNDGGTIVTITNTTPASATITVIAVSPPSLSKGFAPNTIFVGQNSALTIRLNNNDADTNLTGATYTDTLPAGLAVAVPNGLTLTNCGPGTASAPSGGTTITLNNATVTPAQDCIVTVNVTGASGQYVNTIPAGPGGPGSLQTNQGVTNNTPASANLNVQPVGITKAFSPATIDAGDTSTLTITLQNPTGSPYTGVALTDDLTTMGAGFTIAGAPSANTCGFTDNSIIGTALINVSGGTIPPSATPPTPVGACIISIPVQAGLNTNAPSPGAINTIPANTLTADQPITNFTPATANLIVNRALYGTKAYSPATIVVGGTSTVTITLTNRSSTPLTGVTFTDGLPAGLTVSGAPASPQCGGVVTNTANSVTLTGGTIPANGSCTVVFTVTSSIAGSYDNTVALNSITNDQGVGNAAFSTSPDLVVVNSANLPVGLAKSFQTNPIAPGQTSRLRITVTAPADTSISGVNLTDTLPPGLVIANPPAPAETCPGGTLTAVNGTGTITFTNNAGNVLAAGSSCNIDVWVTSTAPGTYTNTIPANAITTIEGRSNLNPASANIRVTSLNVTKAFYPTVVQAGGSSTMTITLENTTDSALINVSLTDTLPGTPTDGIRVAATPNASTTCTGGTITANPGSNQVLMAGGTVPAQVGGIPGLCTITVDVVGLDSTPVSQSTQTNNIPIANVSATVQSTGTVIQPRAAASAILTIQNLTMGIVKGFNPVLVYGGAYSTMSVQLINPNTTATLTGIAFTDDMTLLGAGMQLANPVTFNTGTCGGALTGNPGDTSFSFSGGVLPPSSSCTLTLRVVMNVNGNLTNRIPAGAVTTFNGVSNPDPTEASLTNLPGVSVSKSFNPAQVLTSQPSTLTITIRNTSNVPVVNMGLADNLPGTLPDGLEVANPANASNTCGGTLTANPGSQTIQLSGGGLTALGSPGDSCVITVDVISTRPGTYINTIPAGALTANGGITNNDPATDTLTVLSTFSLGNRVWFDTDNSSTINGTEVGVNGVTIQLYAADAGGNPTGAALATTTTANGGYYRFDNLSAGDYVAVIPSSQFNGGPLTGYWSSGTTLTGAGAVTETAAPDPDNDTDSDDNGARQTAGAFNGAVISGAVTLGPAANEPINDTDADPTNPAGESPNDYSNRTVDFGFYRGQLGNLVFVDANNDGAFNAGETPLAGATVQLFAANGTTEINVGVDGILGTADDGAGGVTTGAGGTYLFSGLPEGDYIVRVTPPVGYSSTVDTANSGDTTDANQNIDNNDNGIGTAVGQASSSVVTLNPGNAGAATNNTVTDATGTTYDPTVDFGFVGNNGGFVKSIASTSEAFTAGTDVAVGEIVTYEVTINLPVGTPLTNVTLTDQMDKGLAFVDCLYVEVAGADQTAAVCPTATVSSITDPGDSAANPANPGRQVVFTIGNIAAQATPSTLLVRYRAIVLDVIENQEGGTLNNSVTWAWTGGSFTTSAPNVRILEPDLTIDKTATPSSNVLVGSTIRFTLSIEHTLQSSTDAFDVVVTDILPPSLEYVPGSVVYAGLAPTTPAPPAYPGATSNLIFQWDLFPLGATSTITFDARLLSAPAANTGSVAWTSLPIDPGIGGLPVQLSVHNVESTERWYDPLDAVNVYGVSATVNINGRLPNDLPDTGFAPFVKTDMSNFAPVQYTQTDGLFVEIPSLGIKMPIVGVPLKDGEWDVSWLGDQAGWLEGSAFPSWNGNSVLTGHVYGYNGLPGPFFNLSKLKYGDKIIIHAYGAKFTYEVRGSEVVKPNDASVMKHEEKAWLTLLTCKEYDAKTNTYKKRLMIRAVLISVER